MTIDEITDFVQSLDGVLTVRPAPGDGSPEISWGDTFFFYAPDGVVPKTRQPFATVVTKDYPGDESSRLDRPDTFRVNVAAPEEAFVRWVGAAPREPAVEDDPSATDTVMAHPVYASAGWLAVVNPGRRTAKAIRELIAEAHGAARSRHGRRTRSTRKP
ncbi:DUF6194 family protein [Streptomyces sp. NPDC049954]|uniref:DUF6194 family protein n=1 Tax=Streptomyces sp. NPDC049954 TaxID=3155779 RepID=UPI003420A22E